MKEKIKQRFLRRKEKRKESGLELVWNVLSCWLISVGVCLIVDSQFSFQTGIEPILWQTFITVLAAVLFTRQWWIPIIYFGILVPVFFLAISLSGDIYSFFESLVSFITWCINSMPYGSRWYSDQGFYLVHTFINVCISILFFVVSRIKKAWVTVALALVFLIVNYIKGNVGYDELALLFLVAGIFPLIAGEKFQNIKLFEFKNLFGLLGKKWLYVAVSTVIAVAICITSLGIASLQKDSIRNRFCSNIVADIQAVTNVYTKEQKKTNLTLYDLGLVTNSTYIGGNLYEIEPEIIATTNLASTSFVKVSTFSEFDGENWINTFNKGYRINGIFQKKENEFLASRLKDDEYFMSVIDNIAHMKTVKITMKKKTVFLPTLGQIHGFEERTQTINPILFDERGRVFSYYGIKKKYSYTMQSLVYNTKDKNLSKKINGVYAKFDVKDDPLYNTKSEFYKTHTEPLGKLPKSFERQVKKWKNGVVNHYKAAKTICDYFSVKNGYVYTNTPPVFTKGENIVQKLADTREGHCMYYTAAMIAMTRSIGIPSRLAVGYRTIESPDGETQIIDKSSPYAWVECYIPNIGWMEFNPSPEKVVVNEKDNYNKPVNTPSGKNEEPEVEHEEDAEKKDALKWDEVLNIPLILFFLISALAVIFAVVNTMFSHKLYEENAVKNRYPLVRNQIRFYYKDILRQLYWIGFKFKRGETISELKERVCGILSQEEALVFIRGIDAVEKVCYSETEVEQEDITAVIAARNMLENMLVKKNNKIFYIFKRRFMLPIFNIGLKK